MDSILDIHGDEIVLDANGIQITDKHVLDVTDKKQVQTLEISNVPTQQEKEKEINELDSQNIKIEPVTSIDELIKVKSEIKQRRSKKKITLEFITSVLTDKYHNSMTVSEIKAKYGIGHDVYKSINLHSEIFIEEFGKKKKVITPNELQVYWKTLTI